MQQRQPRLGDILDDYCPRERRVTNHAVVAMIGSDVKQTRCSTCDAEHEFKHAKVPRQRRKSETPAGLYAQVAANGPKRVAHETVTAGHVHEEQEIVAEEIESGDDGHEDYARTAEGDPPEALDNGDSGDSGNRNGSAQPPGDEEEGPVHRPLIRASLPRPEGQQPPARPIPEFTIRQPAGRPGRFRPRHQRGGQQGQQFYGGGNRGNGIGNFAGSPRGARSGGAQGNGGRPPMGRRQGGGGSNRNRSK